MQSLIITTKSLIKILIQLFTDSKICWFLLSARKFHNLTCQTVGHSIWSSNFLWRILTHVFVFFNLTCQTVGHSIWSSNFLWRVLTHVFVFFNLTCQTVGHSIWSSNFLWRVLTHVFVFSNLTCQTVGHSIWSSNFLWHVLTHVFVFFHLCYSQTTVKLLQQVSDSHLSENTSFSIIINKLIKNIFIQYYG